MLLSVSCPSAGNCTAGGFYTDGAGHLQAFVVSQRNGRWGKALEVPGTAALNRGGSAEVKSVSCTSLPGNCTAVGEYRDVATHFQAFVVSQRGGRWGKAQEVPGTAALNKGGLALVNSVSCTSPGNCTAGGLYADRFGSVQAFVVSQRGGRWGKALEVPGTAALNKGSGGEVNSVSCTAPGTCTAGGRYANSVNHFQAFVVSQRNGRWGKAFAPPGTAALNAGGNAELISVSCATAGNCAAVGFYIDVSSRTQAFVVNERNGGWGKAFEAPGTAALNAGGNAAPTSVFCASAGNCAAVGSYIDQSSRTQAFVVSERDGQWVKALEVPGTAALNAGGSAYADPVSCATAGNCAFGGYYKDGAGHFQAYVVSERDGKWGTAIEVPGTAKLNAGGNAELLSVSCPAAGKCTGVGNYRYAPAHDQPFVVTQG